MNHQAASDIMKNLTDSAGEVNSFGHVIKVQANCKEILLLFKQLYTVAHISRPDHRKFLFCMCVFVCDQTLVDYNNEAVISRFITFYSFFLQKRIKE